MEWSHWRSRKRFSGHVICAIECNKVSEVQHAEFIIVLYSNWTNKNCFSFSLFSSLGYRLNIQHRARAEVVDFSIPYFQGGVSLLASPKTKSEIPLLAFLLPFSPELWIAIFTSLNITAVAVAVYEWLSPFGLNPWGRQRSKNFSLSSGEWQTNNKSMTNSRKSWRIIEFWCNENVISRTLTLS